MSYVIPLENLNKKVMLINVFKQLFEKSVMFDHTYLEYINNNIKTERKYIIFTQKEC